LQINPFNIFPSNHETIPRQPALDARGHWTDMAASKVHWLKPTLMVGWLLLGAAVALGHHFFYSWLDGRLVQSKDEQEWYGRIGTSLAFLTKTLLTAASTIAYAQLLWRTLRSRAVSIRGVDALFGVTSNAWNLASLELWRRGPLPAAVAAILW
jgi:hypothetical protein